MGRFDVFVIGPMGKDKDDPAEKSTPISLHIERIEAALNRVLPEFPDASGFQVATPAHGAQDIQDFVFHRIDGAKLAIADISARSPSVMYELALVHSLGIPVVIIDDESRDSGTIPFYCAGANILRVPNFELETLATGLRDRLKAHFQTEQDLAQNPISAFYGLPLVEVSGASSVAAGYYANFISRVLSTRSGLIEAESKKSTGFDIKGLRVVQPSPDFDINEDLKRYGSLFSAWNGGERLAETTFDVEQPGYVRGLSAYFVDGYLYDYPRTIEMLKRSRRFQRLDERRGRRDAGTFQDDIDVIEAKISKELVGTFMSALGRQVRAHRDDLYHRRFEIISFDRLSEILRSRS